MIPATLILIALAGTLIGTYTDIKTRLVPDWTNYFMLAAGLGGWTLLSLIQNSFWPIAYSLAGTALLFGLGYVLYRAGAWGGGDTKLLTAFGAIFGPFPAVAAWPFLMSLWLNIVIFGAIFGILGMLILFVKHRQKTIPTVRQDLAKYKHYVYALTGVGFASIALSFYKTVFSLAVLFVLLALLAIIFRSTEKVCMHKKIKPSELVEGDWITHSVEIGDFSYEPKKSGVEKLDIQKLMELEKSGKLISVEVKDGLPYLPAFLAALIVTLAYGDVMYQIFSKLLMAA